MDGRAGFIPAFPEKLIVAGNGLWLEYWPVLNPPPQSCQICLAIVPTHAAEPNAVDWQQDWCSSLLIIRVNLNELETDFAAQFMAQFAAQFATLPLSLNQRKTLTDPALLHFIQLLHQEIQAPRPMSQLLIASIAQVLINHLISPKANHERSNGFLH